MAQGDIILSIIKLALGGISAFCAIMLWSKTRDAAWMSLAAGVVTSYASFVYDMMTELGVILPNALTVAGIPLPTFLFAVVPSCFFIVAFILMIRRNR
ncbi:hypothetical protein [Treponema sp. Marseille-Q4130]|uniref:hypothetical protein n=1 Tax=Treponema sp. Marseille-Q4130 TaxID=2766702 RepID=UPI00165229CC|nr:hypothetical protein [Treponema sp. Marseille-Q4130]MBC6721238.1 hypothetical protein [Treponema sp. Marseille-Q4130]